MESGSSLAKIGIAKPIKIGAKREGLAKLLYINWKKEQVELVRTALPIYAKLPKVSKEYWKLQARDILDYLYPSEML
tara:strand:- start:6238 stop:6468 length:231 start_codon:yes stop_codon:yes gene_type:complete